MIIISLPAGWQYLIWLGAAGMIICGITYKQIVTLRRMKDKAPEEYKVDARQYEKSSWIIATYFVMISAFLLLTLKPGAELNVLYALYIGLSVPSIFEKGANWSHHHLENFFKKNISPAAP